MDSALLDPQRIQQAIQRDSGRAISGFRNHLSDLDALIGQVGFSICVPTFEPFQAI